MDTPQFDNEFPVDSEILYKEKELAKILRISLPTLKRLRYAGKIEFLRVGMQVRYTRPHLEAYLRKCNRKAY